MYPISLNCESVSNSQIDEYDIYKSFRRFGEIFDVSCDEDSPQLVHIDFATIVDDRINREQHQIILDEKTFSFRSNGFQPYDDSLEYRQKKTHTDPMLEIAPDADSPQNILNVLNDYCLLDIFHLLKLPDLLAVANVCQRFKRIAMKVYRSKYKIRTNVVDDLINQNRESTPISLARIELLLRTFGPEVSAFDVDGSKNTLILLAMCSEYCTKLQYLRANVDFSSTPYGYLRRILPHLNHLELSLSYPVGGLFVGEWPLETLYLFINDPDVEATIILNLPRLRVLSVWSYCTELTEQLLAQLLSRMSQLQKLRITVPDINSRALHRLPQYLPNVQEIALEQCEFNGEWESSIVEWGELRSLQSLILLRVDTRFVEMILQSLVAGRVPLKSLQIKSYIPDNNNVFKFIDQMPSERIIQSIQQLPSLTTIIFFEYENIDKIKNALRRIVQANDKLFIQFRATSSIHGITKKDCKEIAELVEAHQEMKIEIEAHHDYLWLW